MRIAVIGTGISGMTAAHLLCGEHDLVVFEMNGYVGGHTHTQDVPLDAAVYPVDTGFTLFNEERYPHFVRLLERIGARRAPVPRGFGFRCERTGIEFSLTSLNGLFAQRTNLFRSWYYRMLRDANRFCDEALDLLASGRDGGAMGEIMESGRYSQPFVDCFLVPLYAAVWWAKPGRMRKFPMRSFVEFLDQHCLLQAPGAPDWFVVPGGAQGYAERLVEPYRERVRLNCGVTSVRRGQDVVEVTADSGEAERFDHVVIAAHADQALAMLDDPSETEREVLGAFAYWPCQAVIHRDATLLPRRRAAQAGWCLLRPESDDAQPVLTYNVGFLHHGMDAEPLCVTLDPGDLVAPACVLKSMTFYSPLDTPESRAAQTRHHEISGHNRTSFCGAYWGQGCHEDGVRSALAVCEPFGKTL